MSSLFSGLDAMMIERGRYHAPLSSSSSGVSIQQVETHLDLGYGLSRDELWLLSRVTVEESSELRIVAEYRAPGLHFITNTYDGVRVMVEPVTTLIDVVLPVSYFNALVEREMQRFDCSARDAGNMMLIQVCVDAITRRGTILRGNDADLASLVREIARVGMHPLLFSATVHDRSGSDDRTTTVTGHIA